MGDILATKWLAILSQNFSVRVLTKAEERTTILKVDYKEEVLVVTEAENRVKLMLEEPLDSVMTLRMSVGSRQALREIGAYYKVTEQDVVRRFVAILATAFHDMRSQVAKGSSFDELLSRTTRLTVAQFISMSPSDLRRAADEFNKAAYAFASLIEGSEG